MSLVSQWMVKEVRTVAPGQTVIEACLLMKQHKIGCVVVTEDKKVVGMFTERDMVNRVGSAGRDVNKTLIKEVMTSDVI
nr:CBS domain-containing protein [Candidatus Omnitrophota bacterium]